MNTKQILTGIQEATCKLQLSLHIDLIEKALDLGRCDYDWSEELKIAKAIEERIYEFNERVFH